MTPTPKQPQRRREMTTYKLVKSSDEFNRSIKLEKAFDSLTRGMDNWKMPIKAKIEESMFSLFNEACVHYTGSTLTISKRYADGKVDVKADGYYKAIGA